MEFLGYIGAIFIGLILGLIGSGGSILTLPIFVYIFGINPVLATSYSLFVVGLTSGIGVLRHIKKQLIDFKVVTFFSIFGIVSVFITRKFIVPRLPEILFQYELMVVSRSMAIMLFFALLMFGSGVIIIKNKPIKNTSVKVNEMPKFLFQSLGVLVGFITGLVGAGGGFLIIPILVILAKLPFHKAVVTSLFVISINSLFGFIGDVTNSNIDWLFLITFAILAILGIQIGMYLATKINAKKLKNGFGWFISIMALYIIIRELS